jgi:hypothetical protein
MSSCHTSGRSRNQSHRQADGPKVDRLSSTSAESANNSRKNALPTVWLKACDAKTPHGEDGRFGRPKPPLFPHDDARHRHRQRAYRHALADPLTAIHGWLPTPRIAHFEVKAWIHAREAGARMAELLSVRV